jgi:large subunit ribosomal protein L24
LLGGWHNACLCQAFLNRGGVRVGIGKKGSVMTIEKYKLKKNDIVKIMTGKNKGNSGRILKIDPYKHTVLIEGQNMVKKAMRKKKQNDKGGISEVESPIQVSNVMLVCKKCGLPTKIRMKVENDKKVRICGNPKCNEEL